MKSLPSLYPRPPQRARARKITKMTRYVAFIALALVSGACAEGSSDIGVGGGGGSPPDDPECGNGKLEGAEVCDEDELDGETCASQGFDKGTLKCGDDCQIDTSDCSDDTPVTCGNDQLDEGETCDGSALGDATCESLGFAEGTLSCDGDCGDFDTSECTSCGNDEIDAGEDCDGDALDGETCGTQGFDAGTLACTGACSFDTSGCTMETCGDGNVDLGEDCDGSNLDGESCDSVGFATGTLSCTNCQFNTSACSTCGDNVVDGTDACDGTNLDGETCSTLGFSGGTLSCTAACAFNTTACSNLPLPTVGQIVITEIMSNPEGVGDSTGEWFEVKNVHSQTLSLQGCTLQGNNESLAINASISIAPGAYATLAVAANPGFTPSHVYGSTYTLANGGDTVRIVCNATTIDQVVYTGGFPLAAGKSLNLDPTKTTAALNDQVSSWCEATVASANFTTGDLGTPNQANSACVGPVTYPIGFCRLQDPATITGEVGTASPTIYGRVFIAGLTDLTGMNDPAPQVRAQVGYGPDGSDAAVGTGWTWIDATSNAAYAPGAPGYEANNDEYQGAIASLPAAGSYDYAFRFSGDTGATWTVCDTGAGTTDGYTPATAGQMTTTVNPNAANLIFSEYLEGSSNNKYLEIHNVGSSAVALSSCSLRIHANGNTSTSNITLTGFTASLAPGATHLICHTQGTLTLPAGESCDSTGSIGFNGNDAIELICGGERQDVIGRVGEDPGTAWGTGTITTFDKTLRRKCTVTSGDRIHNDAFDPATEWDVFPPTDNSTDLGLRVCTP